MGKEITRLTRSGPPAVRHNDGYWHEEGRALAPRRDDPPASGDALEVARMLVERERLANDRDAKKLRDRESARTHELAILELRSRRMAEPRPAPMAPPRIPRADSGNGGYAFLAFIASCSVMAFLVMSHVVQFREFAFALAVGCGFCVVLLLLVYLGMTADRYRDR